MSSSLAGPAQWRHKSHGQWLRAFRNVRPHHNRSLISFENFEQGDFLIERETEKYMKEPQPTTKPKAKCEHWTMHVIIFQILFNLRLELNCCKAKNVSSTIYARGLHQHTHGLINQNRDGAKKPTWILFYRSLIARGATLCWVPMSSITSSYLCMTKSIHHMCDRDALPAKDDWIDSIHSLAPLWILPYIFHLNNLFLRSYVR